MGVVIALIAFVSLIVGGIGGWLGTYLKLRAQFQAIEHEKATTEHEKVATEQDKAGLEHNRADKYWDAYEKRIAILTAIGDGDKLKETQAEYERTLQAWQQTQQLATLAPRGAVSVDAPKLPPEQTAQLVELLAGSTRLPAILLTADDYVTRGSAYYEAGDYEQALEAFSRALDILPNNAVLVYNRATTLANLKRYREALKGFDHALQLKPGDPETLNNRAATLGKLERYEDAVKGYDRTLEVSPDLPESLTGRGAMLDKLGKIGEALRDHDRALELRPDYPEALSNRGSAYIKLQRYQEAVEDCNRALLLRPAYSYPLYNRACAYSGLGQFPEALRDLAAAIERDGENRKVARTDEDHDFGKLRNDPTYGPQFWEIVGREDDSAG